MRFALAVTLLAVSISCASNKLACRIVRSDGTQHPAPWHTGAYACLLRIRAIESMGDPEMGVELRGPKDQVKALRDIHERDVREQGIEYRPIEVRRTTVDF